jgi:small ligand-binding sensory domain FIST
VGLDPDRGGLSVPESMFSGQEVAFVRLDPDAARLDFAERLEGMTAQPAGFGLYLNCQARGASLFGEAGVEAKQLANAFAHCPVAGVTGPFQIAPLASGRAPSVLTYAGVLALVGD